MHFIKTKELYLDKYCIYITHSHFFLTCDILSCWRKLFPLPMMNDDEYVTVSDICLNCRGSKIVIEGENLDSVYRTIIRFKPNESHLKPVTRVHCSL